GRLSFIEPRPYEAHDPRHGLPVIWLPVCMKLMAGSWLIASVFIERMKQRSSAILATFGSISLIHMPEGPYCANLYFDGATGNRFCPEVIVVRRWPMRTESGRSLSNISTIFGL